MTESAAIAVLCLTLNEERYIKRTLESLRAQSVQPTQLILVDSHSKDATVSIASKYVDVVAMAPKGKLKSIAAAMDYAARRYDIAVITDGDTWYPPGWFKALLAPFVDKDVVMTYGPRVYDRSGNVAYDAVAGLVQSADAAAHEAGFIVSGQNRAFRVWAYHAAGGLGGVATGREKFWPAVWFEEEFAFHTRMAELGRRVFVPDAWCVTRPRYGDPTHTKEALLGQRM